MVDVEFGINVIRDGSIIIVIIFGVIGPFVRGFGDKIKNAIGGGSGINNLSAGAANDNLPRAAYAETQYNQAETHYESAMIRITGDIEAKLQELIANSGPKAKKKAIQGLSDDFSRLAKDLRALAQYERAENRNLIKAKFGASNPNIIRVLDKEKNEFIVLTALIKTAANDIRSRKITEAQKKIVYARNILVELVKLNEQQRTMLRAA